MELNSSGVLTSNKIFTKIVSKESLSCKCYDNEALIPYCAKRVSFEDKIFGVGFKFLSPEGLLVQVLFWGLGVGSSVCSLMCVSLMRKIEGAVGISPRSSFLVLEG